MADRGMAGARVERVGGQSHPLGWQMNYKKSENILNHGLRQSPVDNFIHNNQPKRVVH
jgi:hypothetical protein